jgi:tagatose-1,6-bisphosphate aldolase
MTQAQQPLSLGKERRLAQASTPQGAFLILAIDHRGPLRRRLGGQPGTHDCDAALASLKEDIVRELAPMTSAVLLDPEVGLEPCIRARALPGSAGLLIALDTGSTGDPAVLKTGLVEGWSVERIARAGAAGVKLLVYYHPEAPQAPQVESTVRTIASACAQAEIPLFLEPLTYSWQNPGQPLPSKQRRERVMQTAQRLVPLGVDVLKIEFPINAADEPNEAIWREACRDLAEACPVPWVLLSGGVAHDVFLRQVAIACEAGARGVIAGRAIWSEAVTTDTASRRDFLRTHARSRLYELRSLCSSAARPFWEAFHSSAARGG